MTNPPRLACDLRTASDTPQQRASEYQNLFATALSGRDRTERMVRFRFRRAAVDENHVRSLVAREQTCCPFFDIRLTTCGDELWWETRIDDNPEAVALLEELYELPDHLSQPDTKIKKLIKRGLLLPQPGTQVADPEPIARTTLGTSRIWAVIAALAGLVVLIGFAPQSTAATNPAYDYYQVINRSDECLSVSAASQQHAAKTVVADCYGSDHQQWRLVDLHNGYYQVRVGHTDMCLDVAYRALGNNASVVQGVCADPNPSTSWNQHWQLVKVPGYYLLKNRNSGRCLDKGTGDVIQWDCHGAEWQQWSFADTGLAPN